MVRQAHHPEPVEGQYPNYKFQKIPLPPLIKEGKQVLIWHGKFCSSCAQAESSFSPTAESI